MVEQQSARAAAQEEARGAALLNFGMLVTATVLEEQQLRAALSAINNLAPTARVTLRPVWGSQDSAFAAALPGRPVPARPPQGARVSQSRSMRVPLPRRHNASKPAGPVLPGPRGWSGPARGRSVYLQAPAEWRATSIQTCGLWPFSVGAGAPLIGAPLGKHILTGATVCGDPISWFQRAGLLTAPTASVLGLQGFGKSTVIRRMALSLAGFGVLPLVLGDLKPDYTDLIAGIDGQVVMLGRGRGYLNLLDMTLAHRAAELLGDGEHAKLKRELLADAVGRRHTMVSALISIQRGHPPDDREDSILAAALRVLDERFDGTPVLSDLLEAIESAPERVRMAAFDRGSLPRYQELVEPLQVTLQALLGDGRIGEMFSRHSTVTLDFDRPAAFDVSSIPEDQTELVGAALAACWGVGFGAVNVTHTLAEAGLAPMRHYFIILDELWRALIAGRGMVDRTNSLTRLNRQWGVGVVMCSHTIKDLLSLPDEHERMKALGLIERSGMLICGALPPEEMPRLAQTKDFSVAEQRQLISWQDPPAWSTAAHNDAPPGRGNFMIKIGGRPGIPFRATLTPSELKLNDTSKLWHENSRRGDLRPQSLHPQPPAAVSNPAHRHATGSSGFSPLLAGTIGIAVVAAAAAEAAVQLGASLDHWRHPPPVDPLSLALELADGKTGWPPAATSLLAIGGGLLLADRGDGRDLADPGPIPPHARRPSRAGDGTRPRRPPRLTRQRARYRQALRRPAGRPAGRASGQQRPAAVRHLGGHAMRHLGSTARQNHRPGDPHAALRSRRRVCDLQQARPALRHPPAARRPRAGVELRSRTARGRRAHLVVEPAHLRDLRPPGARADRRVRRRLPRPRRAAGPVL